MGGLAWAPFYWGDYLRDTSHMSLAEHGAYLLLMSHYYSTGEPLPANEEQLLRICRCICSSDADVLLKVLQEKFYRVGDVWRQDRIDAEIAKQQAISEKRRVAAGKRGGLRPIVGGRK